MPFQPVARQRHGLCPQTPAKRLADNEREEFGEGSVVAPR